MTRYALQQMRLQAAIHAVMDAYGTSTATMPAGAHYPHLMHVDEFYAVDRLYIGRSEEHVIMLLDNIAVFSSASGKVLVCRHGIWIDDFLRYASAIIDYRIPNENEEAA